MNIEPLPIQTVLHFLDGFGIRLHRRSLADFHAAVEFWAQHVRGTNDRQACCWWACHQLSLEMKKKRRSYEAAVEIVVHGDARDILQKIRRAFSSRGDSGRSSEIYNRAREKIHRQVQYFLERQQEIASQLRLASSPDRIANLKGQMLSVRDWLHQNQSTIAMTLSSDERQYMYRVIDEYEMDTRIRATVVQDVVDSVLETTKQSGRPVDLTGEVPSRRNPSYRKRALRIAEQLQQLGFDDEADEIRTDVQ